PVEVREDQVLGFVGMAQTEFRVLMHDVRLQRSLAIELLQRRKIVLQEFPPAAFRIHPDCHGRPEDRSAFVQVENLVLVHVQKCMLEGHRGILESALKFEVTIDRIEESLRFALNDQARLTCSFRNLLDQPLENYLCYSAPAFADLSDLRPMAMQHDLKA